MRPTKKSFKDRNNRFRRASITSAFIFTWTTHWTYPSIHIRFTFFSAFCKSHLSLVIKTIIYENYNLLGNSRLAYMSTADAQHVTGCLILNTKPFILPMNNFGCIYSQIHKRSLLSVLFCVRRWISLSQNLRTRKSPNPFFIVIPGVVEINNVT